MRSDLRNSMNLQGELRRFGGKDILRVANVQFNDSGNGFYIDGWDQFGRQRRHYINVHEQPIYMPEIGDVVVGERGHNQVTKVTGRVLTPAQFRAMDIQPGDYIVAGPKRIIFFTDEFLVKNRALLDELSEGGGHNLLMDAGFGKADNFTLSQGVTNRVEWVQEGVNGQDGSFLFYLDVPGDRIGVRSKQTHTFIGGECTLSLHARTGNWRSDDRPVVSPAHELPKLSVYTGLENRETLAFAQLEAAFVPVDATAPEALSREYADGPQWFRPYGSVILADHVPTIAERFVITYGFETEGHYKEQLRTSGPDPRKWSYSHTETTVGDSELLASPGSVLRSALPYAAPTLLDAELELQDASHSFILLTSFTDDANYEGYHVMADRIDYVRFTNAHKSTLGSWTVTIPIGAKRYYRLNLRNGKTRLTIGLQRGAQDTFLQPLQTDTGLLQAVYGVRPLRGDLVISVFDVFQPYTTQIDNVQLERGAALTGWERATNDQLNIDDLLNRVNDIPADGTTIIADRIGAGTIAGRRIFIVNKPVTGPPDPGRSGVLQSSNFAVNDPGFVKYPDLAYITDPAIPDNTNLGFLILGNGKAWFQDVHVSGQISQGGQITDSDGNDLITDGDINGDNLVFSKNVYDQDPGQYSRNLVNTGYRFFTGASKTHLGIVQRNSYAFVQMTFIVRYDNLAGNTTDNSDYIQGKIFYGTSGDTADGLGTSAGLPQHKWLSGVGNVRTLGPGGPWDEGTQGDPLSQQMTLMARILMLPGIDYYVFPKFQTIHLSGQPYFIDQYQCIATVMAA